MSGITGLSRIININKNEFILQGTSQGWRFSAPHDPRRLIYNIGLPCVASR